MKQVRIPKTELPETKIIIYNWRKLSEERRKAVEKYLQNDTRRHN